MKTNAPSKSCVMLLIMMFMCLACTSWAQNISQIEQNLYVISNGMDTGDVQTVFQRMKSLNVRGMSVAVFDNGKIIWTRSYGLRNDQDAVDSTTFFQAASLSKPLTSIAIHRLVEMGRVSLDTDVNVYLKRWKIPQNEFTRTEKVTLRRLVSHTAGTGITGFGGYRADDAIPDVIQILDGQAPANSKPVRVDQIPGVKEYYSGGGFTILQLLIEDVTGKPFAIAMDELVLKPAGMKQSAFSILLPEAMKGNAAMGYYSNGTPVDGGYRRHPEQAAAGLWTTPSEYARFLMAVGNAYRGTDPILKQSTVHEIFQKVPGGGGLGFGVDGRADSLRYRHSGGNEGYTCYGVAFAGNGRGVVIMTNSNSGSTLIREYLRSITRYYKWPPMWNRE